MILRKMPYTPEQTKTLRQHANALAAGLKHHSPEHPDLKAYEASLIAKESDWVSSSTLCLALGVVNRTLIRWRTDGKITPGTEWRRKSMSNHCIYNLPAIREKVNAWKYQYSTDAQSVANLHL